MPTKWTLTTALIVLCLSVSAQTAQEYLKSGISKHEQQDLKGAIIDYSSAINADKGLTDAYFNRGTCELALKDFKAAMADFTKAIELNPNFAKAYYSRATTYASQQLYVESLPDLDKTIALEQSFPNALTLRGQIRAQSGNKEGACDDFTKAKAYGDTRADQYLSQFCEAESLMLDWPDDEHWKVGDNQENNQMHVIDLIHDNETIDNWTELGNMTAIKGAKNVPMDKAMNMMYDQAKKHAPKAKLTFIEKDESVEYPWIIFTIESPRFINDKRPESQLWYIVQGKASLYTNFRAIKKASIPPELKEKWVKFFKTGQVVNK